MIREMMVDGRKKMVFLLEEGPAAFIVIPFDSINHVDYKRIKDLIGTDKSLMAAMLNSKLDNGKNCLQLYQHIIKVVYKRAPAKPVLLEGTSSPPVSESTTEPLAGGKPLGDVVHQLEEKPTVAKRRAGRPKKTTVSQSEQAVPPPAPVI